MKRPVLLFTDIGDDIDDSLALSFLLGLDDVQILGIVVSHGNISLRAQEAEIICSFFDVHIPIVTGSAGSLTHNTMREQDNTGHIIQTLIQGVSYYDVLCIGPCTDLAKCMMHIGGFIQKMRHIVVQGGVIDKQPDPASYNFTCDLEAATYCFDHYSTIAYIDKQDAYKNPLTANDILQFTHNTLLNTYLHTKALEWMDKFQKLNKHKRESLYGDNPGILSYPYDLLAAQKLISL